MHNKSCLFLETSSSTAAVLTRAQFWESGGISETILRLLVLLFASLTLFTGPLPPALPFISVSDLLWTHKQSHWAIPASDTVTNFSSACVHCTKAEKSFSNQYTELKLVKNWGIMGRKHTSIRGTAIFIPNWHRCKAAPLRLQFKNRPMVHKECDWSGLEKRKEKDFVGGCKPAFAALSYWSLYWDCQALSNSLRSTEQQDRWINNPLEKPSG